MAHVLNLRVLALNNGPQQVRGRVVRARRAVDGLPALVHALGRESRPGVLQRCLGHVDSVLMVRDHLVDEQLVARPSVLHLPDICRPQSRRRRRSDASCAHCHTQPTTRHILQCGWCGINTQQQSQNDHQRNRQKKHTHSSSARMSSTSSRRKAAAAQQLPHSSSRAAEAAAKQAPTETTHSSTGRMTSCSTRRRTAAAAAAQQLQPPNSGRRTAAAAQQPPHSSRRTAAAAQQPPHSS